MRRWRRSLPAAYTRSQSTRPHRARIYNTLLRLGSGEKRHEIEMPGVHGKLSVGRARPDFAGPVPVKLDAVFIGIAQIECFADALIGSAVERTFGFDQPAQRIAQSGPRRVKDREMIKAGRSLWRRRPTAAFPGAEPNVMMITAGRNKCRLPAEPLRQLEAEDAGIEGQRPVDIGHLQMDVTNAHAGVDRGCGWGRPLGNFGPIVHRA